MFEKIYAWLLRLYPSEFREAYGEEMLQLFRDRAAEEQGFGAKVQLWVDLWADLAISVPRQHCYVRSAPRAAGVRGGSGAPGFHAIAGESPRPGALALGVVLSVAVAVASVSVARFEGRRPFHATIVFREGNVQWAGFGAPPQNERDAQAAAVTGAIDAEERQRVLSTAMAYVQRYYIDREGGRKVAGALREHEKSGDYDAVTDGAAFAGLLTRQMREASQDMHLDMVYSREALPDRPRAETPEWRARYRKALEDENCMFDKVEVLPHNIGYLKLNAFPELSFCEATAKSAMLSVNHADAIIFDLRDNRGGYANMVAFIAAYLFDHPEYLYHPRENTTERSWTRSPVTGNMLADKPVYVLTSGKTASAAEAFTYSLKMLRRATVVGETTRGAAHAAVFHRIDDHFGMGIPEARAINPFSKVDWEAIGIEPDVRVAAAEALEKAEELAAARARRK